MENIMLTLSRLLYTTLKKDDFIGKECTGIFTHVPSDTIPPYLIYCLDALNFSSFIFQKDAPSLSNKAQMRLSISCVTRETSVQQSVAIVQKVNALLDGKLLQGVISEVDRPFISFYQQNQDQKIISTSKKGCLQFSTFIFDVFMRF